MLDSYRRILAVPGAPAFSTAALLARLPISMLGLGLVLLVQEQTGSYAKAGAISAASVIANAIGAPVQGRLTDRFGQHRVLPATSALFGLGLALGLLAVHAQAPTPLPHLCAALAGFALPQAGSMVRARWTHNAEPSMIPTAFALEAVLDEVVFIVGPVVVTFLATLINPYVGLAVAGVAGVAGSLLLAVQRRTEPPSRRRRDDPSGGRERLPFGLLAPLMLAGVGFGVLFGGAELVTVAVAEDQGHKELSGVLLAIWAAGSLIAGLLVGARPPRMSSLAQLRIATVVLTVSFVPLLLTSALPLVAVALFVSGFAIAPSMVACTRLVEQGVPRERLTEGIAWFTTGLATGVAPGAALSGWVVDSTAPSWGYLVCLLAGFLAVGGAWSVRVRPPAPAAGAPADAAGTAR
ncbi:MFS transporter [Mumia sp. zg.B53]|uniref:MFS transporter n=1 Tax=unclassified Mumia TaxID=2621872 RepID=UPI001C6F1CD1|nr:MULTISPECIES: MFS transporter [unclassified Mumia]MBW9205287.1 MFS transporter [Mumia sp. zg.B17]MBW9208714.1 MFS transporter [Mumia sp. zg.B21]MBW9213325.1 MFS transporter [Mumia sp. zg.B53]MDD9349183.1 MFS transporter [Mumia sp.]